MKVVGVVSSCKPIFEGGFHITFRSTLPQPVFVARSPELGMPVRSEIIVEFCVVYGTSSPVAIGEEIEIELVELQP